MLAARIIPVNLAGFQGKNILRLCVSFVELLKSYERESGRDEISGSMCARVAEKGKDRLKIRRPLVAVFGLGNIMTLL